MSNEIGQEISGISSVAHAMAKALAELYQMSVKIEFERHGYTLTVKYDHYDTFQLRK